MGWTKQQQDAIDARNMSVIVSAAAGSGKTAVLTERLAQLIADPRSGVRADRIVAVTFTNDAASELKKRLDRRLHELISDNPGEPWLLRQQVLLQSAKISTINAFCFDLLRDNIGDQGITSGFGVLDENDVSIIKAQAMDELFDLYSAEGYDKISALYDRFCIRDHQPLVKVILALDRFLSSVAIGERWLDTAVSAYKEEFEDSLYCKALFEDMTRKLRVAVRLAEENLRAVRDIFPDISIPAADKSLVQAQEELIKAETILKMAENRRFPTESDIAELTNFGKLVTVRSNVPHNAALRDLFKKRRDKVKEIITAAVPGLSAARSDYEESGAVTELLAELVRKFREIVWEKKCAKNSISFDDGERLVLELLADFGEDGAIRQSEAARRISEQFDIIMIDEYQDSNNKQDLIFKLMSRNFRLDSDGEPMYGDNAFVVGDVKQSIYGFRLANPKNFMEVRRRSVPYDEPGISVKRSILLNKNFRSSPEVIAMVNFLFSELMRESCGGIDYTEAEQLNFGAEQYSKNGGNDRLTRINLIAADPETESDDEGEAVESVEAEIVADQIAQMLRGRTQVIDRDGSSRDCAPRDFCILVRKNFYTNVYVRALEKRGISAKGSEESGYLRSREIAVLIDLLRIIANPLQDVPMASVMVSPMYMFGIEELAYIKTYAPKMPFYPTMTAAAKGEIEGFDPSLSARLRDLLDSIDRFRLMSVTMTTGELISMIYDDTDFISVMQHYSDGEKKRANLRLLIQYAANYETFASADGSGGITGFIRHIDRIMETGDYEQGKVSAASGDFVTVQTLHKSKGLEYPFVFIAETSARFKFDSDTVMCSDDGRVGYILYDKELIRKYRTFQQTMLKDEKRRDTLSEEMRLLYVGLTRAKQQLFIDLKCGEKELARVSGLLSDCIVNGSSVTELASTARSFSDWLWLSLMMHGEFPKIAEAAGLDISGGIPAHDCDDRLFEVKLCNGVDPLAELAQDDGEPPRADEKLAAELTAIIRDNYDRRLSETPAKLSVTQIAKKFQKDEEFDFCLKRPRFMSERGRLTGAERGTAIHTFFQYCDFGLAIADTAAEIRRMHELGFLTAAQCDSINIRKIRAFFASELYRRVSAAKSSEREKKFTVAAAQLNIDDPVFERLKGSDGMIKGIIDLVYEEEDGFVIVDYKSDRGTTADALRERYRRQLEIYKAALELTTGRIVKGLVLYSIELEQEIVIL